MSCRWTIALIVWLACLILGCTGVGQATYYINIHQSQIGSSFRDDNDQDILVFINTGTITTTVTYDNYRSSGWLSGDFSLSPLQHYELAINTKMLISFQPNSQDLVMKFTSDATSIKMIAYNRIVTETGVDAFAPLPIEYGSLEYYVLSFRPPGGSMKVTAMPLGGPATVTYKMPSSNGVTVDEDNGYFTSTPFTLAALQEVSVTVIFNEAHLLTSSSNLNGMKITSDQPLNIMVSSNLGYYDGTPNYDFTQNQMLPLRHWGRMYLVSIQNVNSDRLFITSGASSATVSMAVEMNPSQQYCHYKSISAPGEVINFLAKEPSYYIYSDEPIAVGHLVVPPSKSFSMYMVTPLEQFITTAYLYIPTLAYVSFTNVVVVYTNTSMTSLVTLNGVSVAGTWTEITGSGYSYLSVPVTIATVYIFSTSGGGVIGGFVYGQGAEESYTFPLTIQNRNILTGCGGGACYQTNTFDFSSCPETYQATSSSLFCSDVESKFYITDGFLGSVPLNVTETFMPSCPCNCTAIINGSLAAGLIQRLAELKANLSIDVTATGAYHRTKTCATDNRAGAATVGSICAISLISLMALIIIIDMRKLLNDGRHCRRLIRDEYRNKCGNRGEVDQDPETLPGEKDDGLFCLENMAHVVY